MESLDVFQVKYIEYSFTFNICIFYATLSNEIQGQLRIFYIKSMPFD